MATSGLSVGYGYENVDQLVPDCVMADLIDVDKNWNCENEIELNNENLFKMF